MPKGQQPGQQEVCYYSIVNFDFCGHLLSSILQPTQKYKQRYESDRLWDYGSYKDYRSFNFVGEKRKKYLR